MEKITSVNHEIIQMILNFKSKFAQDQMFLVEGNHLVEEALKANAVQFILANKTKINEFNFDKKYEISDNVVKKISTVKTPQGIFAVCKYANHQNSFKKILVLEQIQDPYNVGTLLRTAVGFGFNKVIISHDSAYVFSDKVIRASQGAIFNLNLEIADDLFGVIKKWKQIDYKVITTKLNSPNSLFLKNYNANFDQFVLVLGNEGAGISEQIFSLMDQNIIIDTSSQLESLNVATAGAILMYFLK